MTREQLQERAENKLMALIFFKTKELEELRMHRDGILGPNGLAQEIKVQMVEAAKNQLETLKYIESKIALPNE